MDDIYKSIEEYNTNKESQILIVFDGMIADMLRNKKLNSVVIELLTRSRKLNISHILITQTYFSLSKNITLNSIHYFIMKIPSKHELQQIVFNHSLDIDFKNFINLYKKFTARQSSFLTTDATLASDNSLHFRKNILERI